MTSLLRVVVVVVLLARLSSAAESQFVVLVTGDGIRHQEVFNGVDPELMKPENKKASGIESVEPLHKEFWAEQPKERREKLMPFFWNELVARQGIVFGNQALGSKAVVLNTNHFSYPGYAEILNGQPLAEVNSNDRNWSPRKTILEFIREEFKLQPEQVAAFTSWDVFNWICMQKEGAIYCNAGYERMPPSISNEKFRFWSALQFDMLSPWDSVRHDSVTLNLALEYLRVKKPRFMYVSLGETDDWAHARRYDRTVQTLLLFDRSLKELWTTLQQTEPYRGRTTLIITTDHGRGRTKEDWTGHSNKIPGADEVWIGVFGPLVQARGEVRDASTVSLSNLAATILQAYGLDARKFNPQIAPPLDLEAKTERR